MCSRCVSYMFDQVRSEVLTSLPVGMSIDHDLSRKTLTDELRKLADDGIVQTRA